MKPSTYFVALTEKALKAVTQLAKERIQNKKFWDKVGWIDPSHCDYPFFTQSKELKKLGGVIERNGGGATWEAPKNSRLYELIGIGYAKSIVYYYLLCLGDNREFLLKQGRRSIQLIKCLPALVYRRLLLKILQELQGEFNKKEINRIIKKII